MADSQVSWPVLDSFRFITLIRAKCYVRSNLLAKSGLIQIPTRAVDNLPGKVGREKEVVGPSPTLTSERRVVDVMHLGESFISMGCPERCFGVLVLCACVLESATFLGAAEAKRASSFRPVT